MTLQSPLCAAALAAAGLTCLLPACGGDDGDTAADTRDTAPDTTTVDSAPSPDEDSAAAAETATDVIGEETTPAVDYEAEQTWTLGGLTASDYEVAVDDAVTYAGTGVSIRLSSRRADTRGTAGAGTRLELADYAGYRVRFSARLKTEGVSGDAAINMGTSVGDATHAQATSAFVAPLRGDNDWTAVALELDVDGAASRFGIGVSLMDAGTVWLDDARVEIIAAEGPDDDFVQRSPASLDMEGPLAWGAYPEGWLPTGSAWFLYQLGRDSEVVHGGAASLMISSDATVSDAEFGSLAQGVHADAYRGKRVRLRGWIKTEEVERYTGIWMRVDGYGGVTAFDNMGDRPITGTTDWSEHAVVLDVGESAITFWFGVLQSGNGTTWFDDFTLEEVDESVPVTDLQ